MQTELSEVLSSKNQESFNQELAKYTTASCIGEELTLEQATKLSIALKANSTLQSLNLAITNLNDDSVRVIAKALETNTTLTDLPPICRTPPYEPYAVISNCIGVI